MSLDLSWNGLEDGLAPLAAAIQKGGGAPVKSLNLAGTRPTDQVGVSTDQTRPDQIRQT